MAGLTTTVSLSNIIIRAKPPPSFLLHLLASEILTEKWGCWFLLKCFFSQKSHSLWVRIM